MQYEANTPEEYINQLPDNRKAAMSLLRQVIKEILPFGLEEVMSWDDRIYSA